MRSEPLKHSVQKLLTNQSRNDRKFDKTDQGENNRQVENIDSNDISKMTGNRQYDDQRQDDSQLRGDRRENIS